jgi:hypothetical protein
LTMKEYLHYVVDLCLSLFHVLITRVEKREIMNNTIRQMGLQVMGAISPCSIVHMFFNMLMSSFFNFGFVSRIEKCIFDARKVVLFCMTFF